MNKEKKNISRIFLKNLKIKYLVSVCLIIGLSAVYVYSTDRLESALDFVMKGKFESAYNKMFSYREENPKDELGIEMNDIIDRSRASLHIRKAFSYLSVNADIEAKEEFEKAHSYHGLYTEKIEKKYSNLLNMVKRSSAINKIILELLKNPSPSDIELYEFGRRLRLKTEGSAFVLEATAYADLAEKVERYISKGKWKQALSIIDKYIIENPGDAKAKELLETVNKRAAEESYNKALSSIEKNKTSKAVQLTNESKAYSPELFLAKLANMMSDVKKEISAGNHERALYLLGLLNKLDPDNQSYSIYLTSIGRPESALKELAKKSYSTNGFISAAVMYEYLSLKYPENKKYKVFYNLASSRRYIQEMNLEKVKFYLIAALELAPDEREALNIFDRFQDVTELMGEQ